VTDPRDRNLPAAERLLEAVACLVAERGAELLARALRPEDVTDRAGKGRASYYRTAGFPGVTAVASTAVAGDDGTRLAVLEAAIDRSLRQSAGDLHQVVDGIEQYIAAGHGESTPEHFIRMMALENFEWVGADPAIIVQFVATGLAGSSPAIAASLAEYYRAVTEHYGVAYERLLGHWDYRLRQPFTPTSIAVILMALSEGLALRRVCGAPVSGHEFADAMSALARAVFVRAGDADEVAATIDRPVRASLPSSTRSAVIDSAVRLFEARRGTPPTVDELADAAGCSADTIRSVFGGVAGVVQSAWQEWAPDFAETVNADATNLAHPDPLSLLYRLLIRIAARAGENRALVRALLTSGLAPDGAPSRDLVVEIMCGLLVAASNDGQFAPPGRGSVEERSRSFAVTMRTVLLTTVCSESNSAVGKPTDDAAREAVDYVWAVTMAGRRPAGD
jgi:AcrR family transcriptional regulator